MRISQKNLNNKRNPIIKYSKILLFNKFKLLGNKIQPLFNQKGIFKNKCLMKLTLN